MAWAPFLLVLRKGGGKKRRLAETGGARHVDGLQHLHGGGEGLEPDGRLVFWSRTCLLGGFKGKPRGNRLIMLLLCLLVDVIHVALFISSYVVVHLFHVYMHACMYL